MNADSARSIRLGAGDRRRFEAAGRWFRVIGIIRAVGAVLVLLALISGAVMLAQSSLSMGFEIFFFLMIPIVFFGAYSAVELVVAAKMLQAGRHAVAFAHSGDRSELPLMLQRLVTVFVIEGVIALLLLGLEVL